MGTTCSEFLVQKMNLHGLFEEKILQRATVGLFTLITLQSFLFLVLTVSWRIYMQPPPLESSTLCVTCDDIKQTYPYNGTDHVIDAWRQVYNESVCCGPIRRVMELRIQNEMLKQYFENSQSNPSLLVGESFITDCKWEGIKIPKAKLVGVMDSVPSDILKGHSKIRWNKNGLTFTANKCIHLELEGELFIKRPGYYIVSSTLNVSTAGKNITTPATATFIHSLNLLSHKFGTTDVLMQSQRSIKESNNGVFTSFISAVFKLQMYDRLSVSVSNPNYIARNLSSDHFVAYYTYDMA
ncbi:uncharacterized protein LOC128203447 [Mya arenaria]|uniref:uncharacterized protein LOC128203447 n=1 Tax=Mya arenaria TaxID=6604 RepID=UPI0022DF9F5A|nr:uncharacterized protein LOC128203447 [Mya arenaria]XP_052760836.1 uncharacterized protein LOC128203447 [Mya arenaria]